MFEKFGSMTEVHAHFAAQGIENVRGTCGRCGRDDAPVYPWPLPGFGEWCAACIVVESRKSAA